MSTHYAQEHMQALVARIRLVLLAFGWRGILRRIGYEAALRLGVLSRRLPVEEAFASSPRVAWHHRFDLDAIRQEYERLPYVEKLRAAVVSEAGRILSGEMRFYGWAWKDVGWLPRWHVNAFTGAEYPRVHWTAISDDDPERGDIKDVWEISRLPFTCTFARAYVLTGDDRYPEAWWEAIEDWAEANPPNRGVNWKCGQETSLRGIALCFGLSVFADHLSSTRERCELLERILGASYARVRPTLGYALSQRNNHAVSELVFLLSARVYEDERELLRYLLEVLDDQFYPDGSYAQQSFVYQRLAVQALQWLLIIRPDLSAGPRGRIVDVLARSRDFLSRCSDPVSGWLPNYGPNDGTLLFHLSNSHFRDFRPLLASLGASTAPTHREAAIWLEHSEVSAWETPAERAPTTYITLRGPRSLAFSRIGTGRHRQAHGDQQAIDLWIGGRNVVLDPGTYRYTAQAPWRNALSNPAVHSLALEDGTSQLSVGRFLSEGMSTAALMHQSRYNNIELVVSRRRAGAGHISRTIMRRGDAFAVVDCAEGVEARVRWNLDTLGNFDKEIEPLGSTLHAVPVEDDPESGWSAPLYGVRESVELRFVPLSAGRTALFRIATAGQPLIEVIDIYRALISAGLPGYCTLLGCTRAAPEDSSGKSPAQWNG